MNERTGEEQMELVSGVEMAAMGLLRYFQTRGLVEPESPVGNSSFPVTRSTFEDGNPVDEGSPVV